MNNADAALKGVIVKFVAIIVGLSGYGFGCWALYIMTRWYLEWRGFL